MRPIYFDAEGIKVIRIRPVRIKTADKILPAGWGSALEWHVLVDGDEAGKSMPSTVRSLLNNEREEERDHLTMLPAMDAEHLCIVRFDDVFHRIAMVPVDVPMNMRRVIAKKPFTVRQNRILAIEVATGSGKAGRGGGAPCYGRCSPACCGLARGKRISVGSPVSSAESGYPAVA